MMKVKNDWVKNWEANEGHTNFGGYFTEFAFHFFPSFTRPFFTVVSGFRATNHFTRYCYLALPASSRLRIRVHMSERQG